MMRTVTGIGQLEIREGMTVTPAPGAPEGTAMKEIIVEGMTTVQGIGENAAIAAKTKTGKYNYKSIVNVSAFKLYFAALAFADKTSMSLKNFLQI